MIACALLIWSGALCVSAEQTPSASSHSVLDSYVGEFDFKGAELSPSGRYVAGLKKIDGKDYVVTIDLEAPEMELRASNFGDFYLNWLEWADDDKLLVSVYGLFNVYDGKTMTREEADAYDINDLRVIPQRFTRLFSLNRQTGETVQMFGNDRKMARNYTLGRVTDFLPDDPEHILMPARLRGDLDLFRVNINDGTFKRVAVATDYTYAWYTDRNGRPAFRLSTNRYNSIVYIYAREDAKSGKIRWRKVRTIRLNNDEKVQPAPEFKILYPGPTENTYYVAARRDGDETTGIYLYDFEADAFVETVVIREGLDIEDVIFNQDTRELLGIYYYDDRLIIEMEDPNIQKHLAGLNTYFGNKANVAPIDASEDGNRWLLSVSGPNDPGSYHIYNVEKKSARAIANAKSSLASVKHADVDIIEYQASDGLMLKGYLTRPANLSDGKVPPLVMMPHGGPEMRDYYTFDWRAQVLAAHGYQVFQPNYRGSSGYGKIFADRGRREWGRKMQTDVDDAYAHLISEGLAETGRACVYGESYGGFVAMTAAVTSPDLYKCAISGAGVSDLLQMMEWQGNREGLDSETYKYWQMHIGDPIADNAKLIATSPARNIGAKVTPLLLIHGDSDGVVPIAQSKTMYDALTAANKSVRFVKLEGAGHSYRRGRQEKEEYLEVLTFLNKHLPLE